MFFSMADADEKKEFVFEPLFNGVEAVKAEYVERCKEKNMSWSYVKKKPGLDIRYYINLYRQIKKAKPQIVFLHGGAAAFPAWLAKKTTASIKKIIVRETQANHLKTTIDWVNLAAAMLVADTMVYLSEDYKQQLKTKFKFLYSEKRTVVIPNGINLQLYNRVGLPDITRGINLGMQSRLIDIKDHISLLEAFAILTKQQRSIPLHLFIAGDGAYMETLMQHAANLHIADKVTFTGMLEEPELVNLLHQLHIYIHASLGETMSTSIMQAMACGKTIIASDVPGINNMIEHEVTGLLVPAKNASALATAIEHLLNNPKLCKQLADNACNFAALHYSGKKMLDNYKVIFTS